MKKILISIAIISALALLLLSIPFIVVGFWRDHPQEGANSKETHDLLLSRGYTLVKSVYHTSIQSKRSLYMKKYPYMTLYYRLVYSRDEETVAEVWKSFQSYYNSGPTIIFYPANIELADSMSYDTEEFKSIFGLK